jgi:hypothetical protein
MPGMRRNDALRPQEAKLSTITHKVCARRRLRGGGTSAVAAALRQRTARLPSQPRSPAAVRAGCPYRGST